MPVKIHDLVQSRFEFLRPCQKFHKISIAQRPWQSNLAIRNRPAHPWAHQYLPYRANRFTLTGGLFLKPNYYANVFANKEYKKGPWMGGSEAASK
ncbi:MAG: hypothetical protein CL676_05950 [Bdellovibrionaceae bacterium]|nr:hypothetical protein [Pseudobdellovibrionaceae bacterium]